MAFRRYLTWLVALNAIALFASAHSNAQDDPAADSTAVNDSAPIAVEDIVGDSAIENRLTEIISTRPRFDQIDVRVSSGIVTLNGEVKTPEDSQWLQELSQRTEGVVLVENQLSILDEFDVSANVEIVQNSLHVLWSDSMRRLPLILAGLAILIVTAFLAKFVAWTLTKLLSSRKRIRSSLKDLIFQLATIATWIFGLLVAAVVMFPGMTPARALTLLGVGSVAIGFAFKDIFENFFAGILILWRYPFDRGDFIASGDLVGCVEQITIRNTLIRRLDGELSVVPNAQIFKSSVDVLTNERQRRVRLICGVAYGEDLNEVREVIWQAVRDCVTVEGDRMIEVFAQEFADSSVNFEVTWWTGSRPSELRRSRDEVVTAIKSALDTANIEIPFPYRTLTFKGPIPVDSVPA